MLCNLLLILKQKIPIYQFSRLVFTGCDSSQSGGNLVNISMSLLFPPVSLPPSLKTRQSTYQYYSASLSDLNQSKSFLYSLCYICILTDFKASIILQKVSVIPFSKNKRPRTKHSLANNLIFIYASQNLNLNQQEQSDSMLLLHTCMY